MQLTTIFLASALALSCSAIPQQQPRTTEYCDYGWSSFNTGCQGKEGKYLFCCSSNGIAQPDQFVVPRGRCETPSGTGGDCGFPLEGGIMKCCG
ncbi:uncharacterized protein L3040_002741 [Drepanopeziza brunnea f. sp. 'multigermtubi']|uniref:uncharacterized protein n=1 Tax=Drepanopeziza brunnea f. sp. 'multigermtubi' TaxID=698441 RepID=UPI0023985614|nr:hypothetical protein L3040_002741 [Drepanopeziza brunnea f. sp. 'multigermtubi']